MIIDINAFLGHYPFRQLHFRNAAKMVELMDHNGIDRAGFVVKRCVLSRCTSRKSGADRGHPCAVTVRGSFR